MSAVATINPPTTKRSPALSALVLLIAKSLTGLLCPALSPAVLVLFAEPALSKYSLLMAVLDALTQLSTNLACSLPVFRIAC